jgi:hypothetical protein
MDEQRRQFMSTHQITVFSVSAGMVGVCLTAVGLIAVLQGLSRYKTVCDDLLVVDMMVFLLASAFSYVAFRLEFRRPWRLFHVASDVMVLAGMFLMVVAAALLVWALV